MKKDWLIIAGIWALVAVFMFSTKGVDAQSTPLTITAQLPHASCLVVVGKTNYCFATDGLWQSINGAAYVLVGSGSGPIASGVISFNGLTGVVTYKPPVTSVNSKTGDVILGATTTLN